MDNVTLIILIFLIAAINAFIIAIWVNLIFKIRIKKEAVREEKEKPPEEIKTEQVIIPEEKILKKKFQTIRKLIMKRKKKYRYQRRKNLNQNL